MGSVLEAMPEVGGRLRDRVAVVTGATSGLGRWAAYFLARYGATTAIVGRDPARVDAIVSDISGATGNDRVVGFPVTDLALRAETRRLSQTLLDRFSRIDILVNNAGAYYHRRAETSEGLERTFALNVLAPFALTSALADRMAASAPSRVVMVTSAAHRGHRADLSDLLGERSYRGYRAYGRSKLELLLLTREFSRRLRPRGVMVNAIHPGLVASGFGTNNGGLVGRSLRFLTHAFGRSVRDAGADVAYVASSPELDGVTGVYFSRRRITPGSSASHDPAAATRLFEICSTWRQPSAVA